jgi:transposase
MLHIEKIVDLEQLRQVAVLLQAENDRLHKRLEVLVAQLAALQGKSGSEQLERELLKLQEQMAVLQHRMFGRSSEKSPHTAGAKEKKPQVGHGPKAQPKLPVVELRHELDEPDQVCTVCGNALEPLGEQTEDSEEISVVQRRFVLLKNKKVKYRCGCCLAVVETAPGPQKLIPGGRYCLEFAVEIALQKYAYHLPLERQVRMMWNEGLMVDSQTLWDQLNALERILNPAYVLIHAHILAAQVLHADETRWMLLQKGGSKQWHAWALSTEDAVYYHIDPSRGAEVPIELLQGYKGVVMADGYVSYQTLAAACPDVVLVHCMAHVRRKWVEALPAYPQCQVAVDLIKELYEVERGLPSLRGLVGAELESALKVRLDTRKKESKPRMEKLEAWAREQSVLPGSLLDKAISYMLELWPGLMRFVDDARVPIDNNLVERDLRGMVVGRKNHYGSKSLRGTQVAATFYTLVETASRHGLDPRAYLLAAARHALQNPGSALLPWQMAAQ